MERLNVKLMQKKTENDDSVGRYLEKTSFGGRLTPPYPTIYVPISRAYFGTEILGYLDQITLF